MTSTISQKRVYGRRQGRPMNQQRLVLLDELLPELSIPQNLLTEKHDLTPETIFGTKPQKTVFEIGFGSGEHLATMMEQQPDTAFLGAEPYSNGMGTFLKLIEDERHDHIRVLMDDAMMIANSLAPGTLDEIYILNPDPWHKKRHYKRRIVNSDNLDVFAKVLKPGGKLILSTDVPDLADWMMIHTYNHSAFSWDAESAADWLKPPADWITTKYEQKGAKGSQVMVYLIFTRK